MSHFDFSSSNLSLYIPFIMKPANFREKTKPNHQTSYSPKLRAAQYNFSLNRKERYV